MVRNYSISQASKNDQIKIMAFIEKYWKPNHILARDKEFFQYEFHGQGKINFFLAKTLDSNKILAIQGFIPYGTYPNCHICGVISRVHPDSRIPMLGVELMKKMLEFTKPSSYCGIGTNPKTMIPLVKRFFGRSTGIMDQFYILNSNIKNYKIAKILDSPNCLTSPKFDHSHKLEYRLITKDEVNDVLNKAQVDIRLPKKTYHYLIKRYFENPRYEYKCYKISISRLHDPSLLVTREVAYDDAKALRIIDFIGDIEILSYLSQWASLEMKMYNYEYIDLLSSGIDEETLIKSGFSKKHPSSGVIIPTYFEPFIRENIDIYYEKSEDGLILFKGDADGDRPN